MMVKQQQRRTDRCFLPGGSNNVTLVRFPTQRRPHPSHEVHQPPQAPVREMQGEHGEPETKRICISGSEQTLTNRETAPESCDQTGSDTCSLEDPLSPGDGVQQVVLESSEDNRAAERASGGCLKVTIQRSSESREFGEKDPASERFTCHVCHCTCPSAQSFHEHMSGADHNRKLQQISQSVAQPDCAQVVVQEPCRRCRRASVRWCDVCQNNFTGDVILHRRTTQHKECKKWSRPFCSVCLRLFRTPRKFVEHMKSPAHKQKVQLEKSQEDDMITVDAVGCFETESREGGNEEGGNEEGGDEERGDEEGGDEERGHRVGAEKDIGDKDRGNKEAEKDTKQGGKEESRREEETRREETSEGDKDAQLGERIGRIELKQRGDKDIRKGAKQGNKKGKMGLNPIQNKAGGDKDRGGKEIEGMDIGDKDRMKGAKQGNQEKEMGLDHIQNQARGDKDIGKEERGDKDIGEKKRGDKDIGKEERGDKDIGEKERGEKERGEKKRGDKDIRKEERGDKDIGEKERGDKDIGEEDIGEKDRGDMVGDEEGFDAEELMVEDMNQTTDVKRDTPQELNPTPDHGVSYVVPVSGFFCLLCHKFFFRETSARDQHCSSPQHLQRVLQR